MKEYATYCARRSCLFCSALGGSQQQGQNFSYSMGKSRALFFVVCCPKKYSLEELGQQHLHAHANTVEPSHAAGRRCGNSPQDAKMNRGMSYPGLSAVPRRKPLGVGGRQKKKRRLSLALTFR